MIIPKVMLTILILKVIIKNLKITQYFYIIMKVVKTKSEVA